MSERDQQQAQVAIQLADRIDGVKVTAIRGRRYELRRNRLGFRRWVLVSTSKKTDPAA